MELTLIIEVVKPLPEEKNLKSLLNKKKELYYNSLLFKSLQSIMSLV